MYEVYSKSQQTKEKSVFQVRNKDREKVAVPAQAVRQELPLTLFVLFKPLADRVRGPCTMGRAV